MVNVLIIVGLRQVNDLAGVAQTNRGERFHLAHFERDDDVFNIGERTTLALRSGFCFRQIVEAAHHVLCGDGDGLA